MNEQQQTQTPGLFTLIFMAIFGFWMISECVECVQRDLRNARNKSPKSETSVPTPTAPVRLKIRTVASKLPIAYAGNDVYLSVEGFKVTNTEQIKALCHEVYNAGSRLKWPSTVHVLDNHPNFTPPPSGMYGSEAVQNKVILQVIFKEDGTRMVNWDPFGQGYMPYGRTDEFFQ